MDEKDHVFARFKTNKPSPAERRQRLSIPSRGSTSSSRSVEVVHARLGAAPSTKVSTRRIGLRDRAVSLSGSFNAEQATPAPTAAEPDLVEAPTPVVHVMPAWEPKAPEVEVDTSARAAALNPLVIPPTTGKRPRIAKPTRRVADPFDAADDGANCIRCGHVIEWAREKRGLMICARCG